MQFRSLAALVVLVGIANHAAAYIDVHRPDTLGAATERAQSITVIKVVKVKLAADRGAVAYQILQNLKGKLPCATLRQVFGDANSPDEMKALRAWAKKDVEVVVFRYENRLAIYHDGIWSVTDSPPPKDETAEWAFNTRTEPWFLQSYCGPAKGLPTAVEAILAGKEVVVPVMLGERDKQLRDRNGELIRLRTSLKSKDFKPDRDRVEEIPKK